MLSDISSSAQSLVSVDYTVVRVLEAIVEALSVEGAAVYRADAKPGAAARYRFAHSSGVFWTMQVQREHMAGKTSFLTADLKRESYAAGDGIVGMVAQEGHAFELDRGADRARMRTLGINTHNIRNVLAVPLHIKRQMLGVLVVQNRKNKSSFTTDDIRMLGALVDQAAVSINNAHMYEELARTDRIRQEMDIASDIQRQMLPSKPPAAANLRVHPFIRPAKEVGGDYYDFVDLGGGRLGIVIGDVSGKGLPAGMVMVMARTTMQIVARGSSGAREVMTRFSSEMYPRMRRGQFMTMNYLLWNDAQRSVTFCGAGHEHVLWYHAASRSVERIRAGGVATGILEDPSKFLSETSLEMQSGDVFVLYTDGVTEARNPAGDMFTLGRLQQAVERNAGRNDAERICTGIIDEVAVFTGDAEQFDDMTLLVATVG